MASKGFEAYLRVHPVSALLTPWGCGTPQRACHRGLGGDTISLIDHDHRAFESASMKWMPPKKHQPFAAASKQFLASLVFGKDVLIDVVATEG